MASKSEMLKEAQKKLKFLWETSGSDRKEMKKAWGMYIGGEFQWDSADIAKLKAEKRPILSKNIIAPKVNLMSGLEKQTRTGIKAMGVGGEDDPVALLVTGLLKYEDREERVAKTMARVWKDGNICGVGWIDMDTVMGDDFLRMNMPRREHPGNVMKDPDGKELDQSDWTLMGRQKWMPLERLKSLFPKKLRNIKTVKDLLEMRHRPAEHITEGTDQSELGDIGIDPNIFDHEFLVDEVRERVRAVEIFTKKFDDIHYAVSNSRNPVAVRVGPDKKEAELRVAQLNRSLSKRRDPTDIRFGVRSKKEGRIYTDIFSGNLMLLDHDLDIHNHREFRLMPYYAYLEDMGDGRVKNYGVVWNMIDPQMEKNKNHSTFTDVFSRAPLGGGIYKKSRKNQQIVKDISITQGWHEGNPDDFKEFGAAHLAILGSLAVMEDRNERDAEDVSGINKSMLGQQQGSKESGVLARQRVFQGTLGVQELFENFDSFKMRAYRIMVENIRQFWTAEKMIKAVGQVPGFEVNQFMQAAARLLASEDVMEFDIRLDDGDDSQSAREHAFQSMLQVLQFSKGELPLEAIVEASPWPNKEFILNAIQERRQQAQMAAMAEQQGGQPPN